MIVPIFGLPIKDKENIKTETELSIKLLLLKSKKWTIYLNGLNIRKAEKIQTIKYQN